MWVDCQVPGTSSGICWCECKTAWQKLTLGNCNLCKTLKLSRFSTPFSSHLFTYYWVDDHPFISKTVGVQDIALWWRNIKKEYTRVLVQQLHRHAACPFYKKHISHVGHPPKKYASDFHFDITSQIICFNSRSLSIPNSRFVQYMWSHANTSSVGQDHGCFSSVLRCRDNWSSSLAIVVEIWLYIFCNYNKAYMKTLATPGTYCKSSMHVTWPVCNGLCLDSLNGMDLSHQVIFSWPRALLSSMNRCFQEPQHVQKCSEI